MRNFVQFLHSTLIRLLTMKEKGRLGSRYHKLYIGWTVAKGAREILFFLLLPLGKKICLWIYTFQEIPRRFYPYIFFRNFKSHFEISKKHIATRVWDTSTIGRNNFSHTTMTFRQTLASQFTRAGQKSGFRNLKMGLISCISPSWDILLT